MELDPVIADVWSYMARNDSDMQPMRVYPISRTDAGGTNMAKATSRHRRDEESREDEKDRSSSHDSSNSIRKHDTNKCIGLQ